MKNTLWIMGMPITVMIVSSSRTTHEIESSMKKVFDYFTSIDERFSTYKHDSEISQINSRRRTEDTYSQDMKTVFQLSEQTRIETDGYFNIRTPEGIIDPSGLVKGWSVYHASDILSECGYTDFYIDAGGDIEVIGKNEEGKLWSVGIRSPFTDDKTQIVKQVYISDCGMATSGTYIRGQHIYNPHIARDPLVDIVSLTVIGPNVYEADRFATAAFAMGKRGITFIEQLDGFEGYSIDSERIATMTNGFEKYTHI